MRDEMLDQHERRIHHDLVEPVRQFVFQQKIDLEIGRRCKRHSEFAKIAGDDPMPGRAQNVRNIPLPTAAGIPNLAWLQ